MSAEGVSCSLCVFYGGRGISKVLVFIKKYTNFFSCKFLPIFGHRNPGFGTGSGYEIRKNAGSGSTFNQLRTHNPALNSPRRSAFSITIWYHPVLSFQSFFFWLHFCIHCILISMPHTVRLIFAAI